MSTTEQQNNPKHEEAVDINELARTMTKGIRRWEKVIYPMMIGFIVLAIYGFWLIFNVTRDMHQITTNMVVMTKAVVTMTNTINRKMNAIDDQMVIMNQHMSSISHMDKEISGMTDSVRDMTNSIVEMNHNLSGIYQSVHFMGNSTYTMSSNLSELNQNISGPMNSINSVIPWTMMSNKKTQPRNRSYSRVQPSYPTPYRSQQPIQQPNVSKK